MADFGNLSKLYIAKQRLIQYNSTVDDERKKADVNGDGKVDEADLTLISRDINNAQTRAGNVFDFNHDGKVNQGDWDIFSDFLADNTSLSADLDGDGEVSDEEKAFVESQQAGLKNSVIAQLKKEKFTGIFQDVKFVNGQLYTGLGVDYAFDLNQDGSVDEADWKLLDLNGDGKGDGKINAEDYKKANNEMKKLLAKLGITANGNKELTQKEFYNEIKLVYKNGVACTGLYNGKLYKDGKLNREITFFGDKLYKEGILYSGTHEGTLYKNGEKFTGVDDNKYYEDGVLGKGYVQYKKKLYNNGELVTGAKFYPTDDKENQKLYIDGSLYTGFHQNIYYVEGQVYAGDIRTDYPLHDGTSASVTRKYGADGKIANDLIDGLMYKNGFLFTGTLNGKTYSFGVDITGEKSVVPQDAPVDAEILTDGSKSNEKTEEFQVTENGETVSKTRLKEFLKTVGSGDDSVTYKVVYTYNTNGTERTETNLKTGEVTTYTNVELDENNNVTSYTFGSKTYSDFVKDADGKLLGYTANGVKYSNITTDCEGKITSYTTGSGDNQVTVKDIVKDKDGKITSYSVLKGKDTNAVKYEVILKSDGTERTETNKKTGEVTVYKLNASGKVTASTTTRADGTEITRTYNADGTCTGATVTKAAGKEYSTEKITEKIDGKDVEVEYTVITETGSDKVTKKTFIQMNAVNPKIMIESRDSLGQITYKMEINNDKSTVETTYENDVKNVTGRYTISADGKTITSEVMNPDSKRVENETTVEYTSGNKKLVYTKANGNIEVYDDGKKIKTANYLAETNKQIEVYTADLYELISNAAQPKIYKDISNALLDVINKAIEEYMNENTDDIFGKIVELSRETGNANLLYAADMILKKYKKGSDFAVNAEDLLKSFEETRNHRLGRDIKEVASMDFSAKAYNISTTPKNKALDAALYTSTSAELTKYAKQVDDLKELALSISEDADNLITPITTYIEGLTDKDFYIGDKLVNEADFIGNNLKYYILDSQGNVVNVSGGNLKAALSTPSATLVTKSFYDKCWKEVLDGKKFAVTINGVETKVSFNDFNTSYRVLNSKGELVTVNNENDLKTALANSSNTVVTAGFYSYWEGIKAHDGQYYIESADGTPQYLTASDFGTSGSYRLVDANGNIKGVTQGNLTSLLADKNNTLIKKEALNDFYVETSAGNYTKLTASFFGSSYYLVDNNGNEITNMSNMENIKTGINNKTYKIISSALWQAWQTQVAKNNATEDTKDDVAFSTVYNNYASNTYGNYNKITSVVQNNAQAIKDNSGSVLTRQKYTADFNDAISKWATNSANTNKTDAKIEAKVVSLEEVMEEWQKNTTDNPYKTEANVEFTYKAKDNNDASATMAYQTAVSGVLATIGNKISDLKSILTKLTTLRKSLVAQGITETSLNNKFAYKATIIQVEASCQTILSALQASYEKLPESERTTMKADIDNLKAQLDVLSSLSASAETSGDKVYKPIRQYTISESTYILYVRMKDSNKQAFRVVNGQYFLKDSISANVYSLLSDELKRYFSLKSETSSTTSSAKSTTDED